MSLRCPFALSRPQPPYTIGNIFVRGSIELYVSKILSKHLGNGEVERPIILKPTLRVSYEDADCIHPVQFRNQWMDLTTMVTNLLVSLDDWKFF